jgi:hypothetical protein
METEKNPERQRKSLAVDQKCFEMLQAICLQERRSKIDQLRILVEREHAKLFGGAA